MATKIANLVAKITANTAGFERGMKRSRGSMRAFGTAALKMKALAVGALGAAGVGLGLAKLVGDLKSAAAGMDKLAKTGARLGIATDRLAELRLAAKFTGVNINTLDMALQRMVRRVSEAAKDTGEAKDAIRELGLDAVKLAALTPDQQFRDIAEAMSLVKSQSDRVRLSFKLFDSEGVALINTLNLGEKGLRSAAKEARMLGLAISQPDASKVEKLTDAWTRVSEAVTGLSNRIVIDLAPKLTKIFNSMSRGVAQMRLGWETLKLTILDSAFTLVSAFGGPVENALNDFAKAFRNANVPAVAFLATLQEVKLGAIQAAAVKTNKAFKVMALSTNKLTAALGRTGLQKSADEIAEQSNLLLHLQNRLAELRAEANKQPKPFEFNTEALVDLNDLMAKTRKNMAKTAEELAGFGGSRPSPTPQGTQRGGFEPPTGFPVEFLRNRFGEPVEPRGGFSDEQIEALERMGGTMERVEQILGDRLPTLEAAGFGP